MSYFNPTNSLSGIQGVGISGSGQISIIGDSVLSQMATRSFNTFTSSFTVPVLTGFQRTVVSGSMGTGLKNVNAGLCTFYKSTTTTGQIFSGIAMPGSWTYSPISGSAFHAAPAWADIRGLSLSSMIYLTTDYRLARRHSSPVTYAYQSIIGPGSIPEYGYNINSIPQGTTYQSIGVGALFGYFYSTTTNYSSLFGGAITGATTVESAWLDGSGNYFFAFRNASSTNTPSGTFWLTFYE